MANPTCADCEKEGQAGVGSPPVWLCLDHLSERFAGIGATMRKLQGLQAEKAGGEGAVSDSGGSR